jgi:hypothetical protein
MNKRLSTTEALLYIQSLYTKNQQEQHYGLGGAFSTCLFFAPNQSSAAAVSVPFVMSAVSSEAHCAIRPAKDAPIHGGHTNNNTIRTIW